MSKGTVILKINDKNFANVLLLSLPCKSYNVKQAVIDEKTVTLVALDVELDKIDFNELAKNEHIKCLIVRKE